MINQNDALKGLFYSVILQPENSHAFLCQTTKYSRLSTSTNTHYFGLEDKARYFLSDLQYCPLVRDLRLELSKE